MIYILGQNGQSFGNQFPQLLCGDRLVFDGFFHLVGDYACSGSFELRRHHVLPVRNWNTFTITETDRISPRKMKKAVPEKNGLSKTISRFLRQH